MINIASIKLFRHIIMTQEPKLLYNLFKLGHNKNVNTHCISKYYPKIKPKLANTRGFFVNKMTEVWHNLPINLYNISLKLFDKK